ncbi:MAG: polyprenyl diphosphate synthase [Anaerolineaceae bacterium]|nr:polyprenyl diphosphate synthase [Anaerolineaceae bacterium]MDD4042764.1 polyprenyl diphosphate synthase [Anaerolineaceae bacterium]MDD4578117.1 polyprenyl diphosphate synthase [Anaerolineaceae bacterium]
MAEKTDLPVPAHVAIIMDGNGRWAKERGLPRLAGHRAGTKNLRRIIRAAADAGVKHITFYAFSTENWNRPEDEIKGLMALLAEFLETQLRELHEEGARLIHIGHLDGLAPSLRKKVEDAIELTRNNERIDVILAFNYGGRDEIVSAIKKLINSGVSADQVDTKMVSDAMFTAGIPDPDIVIRTSGEKRTSNFLTWQTVYSEWFFPEVYWPDFSGEDLLKILAEFSKRDRRFGGLSKK